MSSPTKQISKSKTNQFIVKVLNKKNQKSENDIQNKGQKLKKKGRCLTVHKNNETSSNSLMFLLIP
jgi:hypothetical protein